MVRLVLPTNRATGQPSHNKRDSRHAERGAELPGAARAGEAHVEALVAPDEAGSA